MAGTLVQPQVPSTFSTATLGTALVLIAPDGRQSAGGEAGGAAGELALVPPLLGSSQRLLNRDHRAVYFEVRSTGSALLPF